MSTITRTAHRDIDADFPGIWAEWVTLRAAAHRDYRANARRRLGLPFHLTAEQAARLDSDAVCLAQCDNWDARNPEPLRVT